jgi:class 3 adenylate cyclase
LGLIGVAVSIRVAYRVRRQVAQPISNVAASLERVGGGHYFDEDLKQEVHYRELRVLSDGFQSMLQGLQEHYHLRRYVSKATMDSVEAHRDETTQVLGGARAVRTLWFSDIRGFTAFSEQHSPEHVISMLNRYFRIEAEQIEAFGGDIDKFIGDGVMATFDGPDQVGRAVQASLAILDAFRAYNEEHGANITIGIGINTGDVVVGNMGAGRRMDYTCLGDNVNIAARLCDKAEPYQLLLSESAFREVRDRTKSRLLEPISVKGKKEALVVYSVTAWIAG